MGKRSAAATAPSPKAKAAKAAKGKAPVPAPVVETPAAQDPVVPVIAFLGDADLPAPARQMLQAAAPFALKTPKEQRHEHQATMVKEIADLYAQAERQRRTSLSEAQAAVAAHAEAAESAATTLEATTQKVKVKLELKEAKYAATLVANEGVTKSKAALQAEREKAAFIVADKQKQEEKKKEFEEAMQDPWEKLKASAFPSKEWRARNKAISRMLELFETIEVSLALRDALPVALKTAAAERGKFAVATVDHAETAMNDHVTAMAATISGFDATFAEQAKVVSAAEEAVAVAEGAAGVACQESIAAENEWVEEQSRQFEEKSIVSAAAPKAKKLAEQVENASQALEHFNGLLAGFRALAEGKIQEVEAPGAPAEAEPATAAALRAVELPVGAASETLAEPAAV